MRRAIPGLGLLLLAVSFAWFVQLPTQVTTQPATKPRPPLVKNAQSLVVVLDPGHGGKDSGAMCGAVMEKDLTLDVALRAELLLRSAGCTTVLTRDSDRYLSLGDRADLANEKNNSLFVSIHFNDGERAEASGVETYFAPRQSARPPGFWGWLSFFRPVLSEPVLTQSESLARFLQTAMVERTQALNRGTKSQQFYVISHVRHPAALVEGGFITNPADMTKLTTAKYRQQIATAISDGIQRYRQVLRPNEPTLAMAAPAE